MFENLSMTYTVSGGTLNPTHSLTHLSNGRFQCTLCPKNSASFDFWRYLWRMLIDFDFTDMIKISLPISVYKISSCTSCMSTHYLVIQ